MKTNAQIRKGMKEAKAEWVRQKCADIKSNLARNITRKAYQIVKDLTMQRQAKVPAIQDKNGKCLMEKEEILTRWIEYCSELYNHMIDREPTILHCEEPSNSDNCSILWSEVEAAIKFLKKGKGAGTENIPVKLLHTGCDTLIDILTIIYQDLAIW